MSAEAAAARVLHVIEPGSSLSRSGSDAACLWLLTLIAQTPALRHDVLVLGTQRDEDHLLAFGIDTTDRITPLRGDPANAAPAMERFIARRGCPGVTLAWSVQAALACRAARAPEARLAVVPWATGPGPKVARAGAIHETDLREPPSPLMAHSAENAGREEASAGVWPLPPRAHKRLDLRQALEIEDHELVVAFLSDRPEHADPRVLVWAIDMLRLIGIPALALASSRAPAMTPARRMMPMARMGVGLIEVDGPTTPFMPACDILIAAGAPNRVPTEPNVPQPAALLARAAMVQGAPVLALDTIARRAPGAHTLEAMTPSAIVDQIVPLWRAGFRPGDRPRHAAPLACASAFDLPAPVREAPQAGPMTSPALAESPR